MKIIYSSIVSVFTILLLFSCESKQESSQVDVTKVKDVTQVNNVDTIKLPQKNTTSTTIEFLEKSVDFGTITEGKMVEHEFKFKNTGNHPLIISNATASCGCTIPEWTKDAVAPGNEGSLKVKYNSAGKDGKIHKTVSVFANTEPEVSILDIHVEVKPKDSSMGPLKNN